MFAQWELKLRALAELSRPLSGGGWDCLMAVYDYECPAEVG